MSMGLYCELQERKKISWKKLQSHKLEFTLHMNWNIYKLPSAFVFYPGQGHGWIQSFSQEHDVQGRDLCVLAVQKTFL